MSKVRVYELARELKMESKSLVSRLQQMGVDVASHQSTLSADQVVRIKREIQGDGDTTQKSPRVIRRRRRSAGEVQTKAKSEEGQKAGTDTDTESAQQTAEAEETSRQQVTETAGEEAAEAPTQEVQAKSADESPAVEKAPDATKEAQAEPTLTAEAETGEPAAQADAASEKKAKEPGSEAESATEEGAEPKREGASAKERAEAEEQAASSDKEQDAKTAKKATPAEIRSSSSAGGATIVRRASPEEVEARRASRQQREKPRREVRPSRSAEERGPRRPPEEPPVMPAPLIEESAEAQRDRKEGKSKDKDKEKRKLTASEEEAARRKAIQKQRRGQVNMRSLLDQIEETDPELEETAKPVKRKTVYTPQASNRKRDIKRRKDLKKTQITTPKASLRVVKMGHEITVGELAKQLSVKAGEVIKKLMSSGIMVTINQNIDFDTATLVASEYNYEVKSNVVSIDDILAEKKKMYDQAPQITRPPIVTIMGHVDHGKTSILDAIRKAKVADAEAGGITQHIGAYTVDKDGKSVAFLDTPGHEAFSSMRARGAQVTDIVVLVVAADDGVMPQTKEAISHAKAADVPLIVAINKMDKPNINLDRVYTELMEQGVQSEEWGGEVQFVKVSAIKGSGLDDLLEAILLQSEILELKAAVDVPATGVVVEAHLDIGRGPVATIMVQQGTLKVGDQLVAGTSIGRVRAMNNHLAKRVETAGPSTPVEVIGLSGVPMAGDSIDVVEDEKTARDVADWRREQESQGADGKSSAASLDQLLSKVKEADTPEVPVIIKGDTQGSVEAVAESIEKLNTERVRNRIVHKGVGGVNESDVSLAETSNAVIIAFNVRTARGLDDMAEKKGIPIRYFSVIYDIVDALKAIMAGRLPPIQKEVILGHAEVRQTIKVPKIGLVAGTAVIDGKVTRNCQVRLIRDDVVIFSGKVGSLRRFKDDVKEVMQGYECGIGIEGYNDIREGDVIETFIIEEEAPAL